MCFCLRLGASLSRFDSGHLKVCSYALTESREKAKAFSLLFDLSQYASMPALQAAELSALLTADTPRYAFQTSVNAAHSSAVTVVFTSSSRRLAER